MNGRILALLLVLAASVQAQNGTSFLARYGIGELQSFASVRSRGMGSVGFSFPSFYDLSYSNPAMWATVEQIRLQADMTFERDDYEFASASTVQPGITSSALKGLQISFPVHNDLGIRIAGGFLPYSRSDYSVEGKGTANGDDYTVKYSGTGGISVFRVGASVKPLPRLALGAAFQYYFGNLDRTASVTFPSALYYSSSQSSLVNHSGAGFTAGFVYTGIDRLSLAGSLTPGVTLNATRTDRASYLAFDSTLAEASATTDIPLSYEFGASYLVFNNLALSAGYSAQDWSDATIFGEKQNLLGMMYKVGGGLEWAPAANQNDAQEEIWQRTILRLGFHTRTDYVQLNGTEQQALLFSMGAGFPLFQRNRMDLALEYGWSGAAGEAAGKRTMMRLSVSISAGESFFSRRPVD